MCLFIIDAMHIIISDICQLLHLMCAEIYSECGRRSCQGFRTISWEKVSDKVGNEMEFYLIASNFSYFSPRRREQEFQFSIPKRARVGKDGFLRLISRSTDSARSPSCQTCVKYFFGCLLSPTNDRRERGETGKNCSANKYYSEPDNDYR